MKVPSYLFVSGSSSSSWFGSESARLHAKSDFERAGSSRSCLDTLFDPQGQLEQVEIGPRRAIHIRDGKERKERLLGGRHTPQSSSA